MKRFSIVEVLFVAVFVASLITNFILWQEVSGENYAKYLTGKAKCEKVSEDLRALEMRCHEVKRQMEP